MLWFVFNFRNLFRPPSFSLPYRSSKIPTSKRQLDNTTAPLALLCAQVPQCLSNKANSTFNSVRTTVHKDSASPELADVGAKDVLTLLMHLFLKDKFSPERYARQKEV